VSFYQGVVCEMMMMVMITTMTMTMKTTTMMITTTMAGDADNILFYLFIYFFCALQLLQVMTFL
jgi:hypothetical protein